MSFEEKALAQGVQLMNIQGLGTLPPIAKQPPPAAAGLPLFSLSSLDVNNDDAMLRPKPGPPQKKSPDKRKKAATGMLFI